MKLTSKALSVKRVADYGKPNSPGHAVEFEVRVSRRKVFRFIVPFLVATLVMDERSGANSNELAADKQ